MQISGRILAWSVYSPTFSLRDNEKYKKENRRQLVVMTIKGKIMINLGGKG